MGGQSVWTEALLQIQTECLHPHRDSSEICHPHWLSLAQINQRFNAGNYLLALPFGMTTSWEEVSICHAARKMNINSPPKNPYQRHRPIILCAVT